MTFYLELNENAQWVAAKTLLPTIVSSFEIEQWQQKESTIKLIKSKLKFLESSKCDSTNKTLGWRT